jgi:hypothetical protein
MTDLVTRNPATGMRCTPSHWTQSGQIPTPDGCRWCGHDRRGHAQSWKPSAGWHKWTAPTDAQRLARMKARRAARNAARQPKPVRPELTATITADDSGFQEAVDFALWAIEVHT